MVIVTTSKYLKKVNETEYDINYGTLRKGSDTKVEIDFFNASHLSVSKSCGCTTPTVSLLPDKFTLTIAYDKNKTGTINQWVKEKVQNENKEEITIKFNLKGTII